MNHQLSHRMYGLAINPFVILGSLALGALLGYWLPAVALRLGIVGEIYVDLLKMIVLPFMLSAVIFSLQRLLRHGGAGAILKRTFVVFGLTLAFVAMLGIAAGVVGKGVEPSAGQVESYGRILGSDAAASDTVIALGGSEDVVTKDLSDALRTSLVPSNVFASLAQGEVLKSLMFALLFGLAIGSIKTGVADGVARGLDAVYQACQQLTRWLNYPLPVVLVCMSAEQLAKTGLGPLQSMTGFIATFFCASVLVLTVAVVVMWHRTALPMREILQSLRAPFALALATRSSATCMPAMIDALANGMHLPREKVELLVPLSVSLLRIGPVLYYVCATMFIAELYGRVLSVDELVLVGAASVLAGCASAGMTGLVTVSLTSMVCGYLGLPFEAAFILFLAVDPVCDMLRTLVLVIGNTAAVCLICERPAAEGKPVESVV
jgi:Na+/H+-dicarboxylate symporter